MARSYKHTPIFGYVGGRSGESEKKDKRFNNRRLRSRNATAIRTYGEFAHFLTMREVSDPWSMSRDGKRYCKDADERDMRK